MTGYSRSPKLTKPLVFLGVDPGATGGVAVLCGRSASAIPMPRTEEMLRDYLRSMITDPKQVVGAMEQVGGYMDKGGIPCPKCGQKKNRQTGSAMFSFGATAGWIRMGLVFCDLKLTKAGADIGKVYCPPPQEWQRGLRIDQRRSGETDSEWKGRLKWNAEQFFPKADYPGLSITLRTADALMIALYVKRLYSGTL